MKPNLVPYDKFRTENESRAYEFLYMLSHFSPWRVKFGDEKLLKGQEVYNRKVRRDPRTGKIPVMTATPDFRNTHAITGFCGIDESTNPVWFRIHKANNNSVQFKADVKAVIASGFLRARDVLVLDNVAYHCGKENKHLAEWCWRFFGIQILFLPTCTPELNSIELV